MPTPRAHHRRRRAGFSLVLALVVTALLVLAILTATAFLKVESALATTKQTESRARLNALAAVRLAGAALQERLGPDTRVSAPATIYDDPAASSATFPGSDPFEYPILGVWRSWEGGDHDTRPGSRYAGRPHRPDYAAKRSAFDPTAAISGRFLGWLLSDQMGYGGAGNAGPAATGTKPAEPPLVFATKSTVPLVGPASLVLALAASGLNGQDFAFVGYLPQDASQRAQRVRELERLVLKTGQTQLFIETPYRNCALLLTLLQTLAPTTRLAVSSALTMAQSQSRSATTESWRKRGWSLDNSQPAVFAIGR